MALLVDSRNNGVGEFFPAVVFVRVGLMSTHCQHRVEQKYTLLRPGDQVAIIRDMATHVVAQLLKYVHERWRWLHAGTNREREAVRLIVVVIGIRSEERRVGKECRS